jgi:hypothetical protein
MPLLQENPFLTVESSFYHRITRDELSHNVFLMLQECNKFREHQSRELLIALLEEQLTERQELLQELRKNIIKSASAMS